MLWPDAVLYLISVPRRPRPSRQTPASRKPVVVIDPLKLQRLLRGRKAAALIIALIVIVAIACIDRAGGVLPVHDDWRTYDGQTFEVARVIDGDTIDLRFPDGDRATTRVRLWGVNTPEMHARDPNKAPDRGAQEATDFVRDRVEGTRVTLELQDHRLRGKYARLLAYVVLSDGGVLNAELIEQGYSKHDGRWSHEQAQAYDELELRAKRNKRGLWSE